MNLEEQEPSLMEEDLQEIFNTHIIQEIKRQVDDITEYFVGDGNLVEERVRSLFENNYDDFILNWVTLKKYSKLLSDALKNKFPNPDPELTEPIFRRLPDSLRQDAQTQLTRVTDLLNKIDNVDLKNSLEGGKRRNKRKSNKKRRTLRRKSNKKRRY